MWLRRDFNDSRAESEPSSRREIGAAQIQVNVELVAGKLPSVFTVSDEGGRAGVHDIELHLRVRGPIRRHRASASLPVVAHNSMIDIQLGFNRRLAFSGTWTSHDEFHNAVVFRRSADFIQSRIEFSLSQMPYVPHDAPPLNACYYVEP